MLRLLLLPVLLVACAHERHEALVRPPGVTGPSVAAKAPSVADAKVDPATENASVAVLGAEDRCPELGPWERPAVPCLVEARAEILVPSLRFDSRGGSMDSASLATVDALAALLIAHPEIDHLEIHGHVDSMADSHH